MSRDLRLDNCSLNTRITRAFGLLLPKKRAYNGAFWNSYILV